MTKEYDDIIDLPRHVSKTRPQMPIIDRAAQFSPFAALTGHSTALEETARTTEDRIDLDEYMKKALNARLLIIGERLKEEPKLVITHFIQDNYKDGGSYISTTGRVKKIDLYEETLIMTDNTEIPIDEIIKIEGDIFESMWEELL